MNHAAARSPISLTVIGIAAGAILLVTVALHVLPTRLVGDYADGDVFDVLHVLGFATFTFLAMGFTRERLPARYRSTAIRVLLVVSVMMGIAVIAEASQYFTQRDASAADLLRDVFGIASGLTARGLLRQGLLAPALAGIASLTLFGIGIISPARGLAAKLEARTRFPVIENFDGRFLGELVDVDRGDLRAVPGGTNWNSGKVGLFEPGHNASYTGLAFFDFPGDWTGYKTLSFRAASRREDSMTLSLRVNDDMHDNRFDDRFNMDIVLEPVVQKFEIPLVQVQYAPESRVMKMDNIESIIMFMPGHDAGSFFIDDIRLE